MAEQSLLQGNTSFKVLDMSNGPTDLWKRKQKTWFRCADADGNGVVNRKDLLLIAEKFQKYGEMTAEAMQAFTKNLEMWWDATFGQSSSIDFQVLTLASIFSMIFAHMPGFQIVAYCHYLSLSLKKFQFSTS